MLVVSAAPNYPAAHVGVDRGSAKWQLQMACVREVPTLCFYSGSPYNEGAWTGEVFNWQLLPKQYGCTNEGNHDERRHSLTVTREKS